MATTEMEGKATGTMETLVLKDYVKLLISSILQASHPPSDHGEFEAVLVHLRVKRKDNFL